MTSLSELGAQYGADKLQLGYLPLYERHLGHLVDQELTLLEIGVYEGASLCMWKDYFPRARVIGVDVVPNFVEFATNRNPDIEVWLNDATSQEFFGKVPELDIVVDDGSHHSRDIMTSFKHLWPKLKPGGWYAIEDLFTVWETFFGGSTNGEPMIGFFNNLLFRVLHKDHRTLAEMHVHEERIIFLRKSTAVV